jgi:DNA-binding CsgD family transcriptional regulator
MSADHDRIIAPGLISIYELMDRAGVSYKTVLKHIRDGLLTGEQIGGRRQWAFTAAEVQHYCLAAPRLIARGMAARGPKRRIRTPAGYLSLGSVAKRCGCSHWFVRDQIKEGKLKATPGKNGKLFVAKEDAAPFVQRVLSEDPGRPYRRKPKRRRLLGAAKRERDEQIVRDHLNGAYPDELSIKYNLHIVYINRIMRESGNARPVGQTAWREEFKEKWRKNQRALSHKGTLARWGKSASRAEDILADFESGRSLEEIAMTRGIALSSVKAALKRARGDT